MARRYRRSARSRVGGFAKRSYRRARGSVMKGGVLGKAVDGALYGAFDHFTEPYVASAVPQVPLGVKQIVIAWALTRVPMGLAKRIGMAGLVVEPYVMARNALAGIGGGSAGGIEFLG